MLEPTSSATCPPLARAFLALADTAPEAGRRSLPRAVVAALAAGALALSVPLAWLADQPVAVLGTKAYPNLLDEEAA
jgi:hypothetical protein